MDITDDDHAQVKGDLRIQAADACGDYMSECGLPASHIIGDFEYEIVSYTMASAMSEDEQNQLFAIFEVNMRTFYEQNWGWDKKMKW
jgi:hypothetical protein